MKLFKVETAASSLATTRALRRADRTRRHAAIRAHAAEALANGWVASATLFATGDFFAAAVAKRLGL